MAKIKYHYDTESCRYERIKVTIWDMVLNFLGFFVISLVIGIGIFFLADYYFESPGKAILRQENDELKLYYDVFKKKIEETNDMLTNLQKRDDEIYRVVFGAEPLSEDVRKAGVGGTNRYSKILEQGLKREDLILENIKKLDEMQSSMYVQTKSYDEIIKLSKNKEAFLASLPAIQPVSNKELKRLASGFGYRIDPVLKVRKKHEGIDFSVKKRTPVYATGDGVVSLVKSSFGGYGRQIEINHGYGYKTKYAHLHDFVVREGQKVKRGELIAYSGNTGKSTAPHLHYEVIKEGKKVNPVNYFYQDLTDQEYAEIIRLSSIVNQSMEY